MQTTLLGLAIAIILALVAALVGPLLIDWGSHRALFEAEASRLIGVKVRVAGALDARLLPSPRLVLHDIVIGDSGDAIRARSLAVEFALGPLMRGEWRAAELHLAGPQIALGLDASGHVSAPNLAITFRPDELAVDRLSIEDGTISLTDASSGAALTLGAISFNGEARSLVGPIKGEGSVTTDGRHYPYRLAVGRVNEEGGAKIHVTIAPVDKPLAIDADGTLALTGGEPHFDGTISLSRPVGLASRGATQPAEGLTQPWQLSGKIKASGQSALMQNLEFQYGSDEQGFRLTGVADLKFGAHPRFNGVLSARQIDVDRANGARQPPAAIIRRLVEMAAVVFRPSLAVQIGVGIDQITLGGSSIQNLRGDISSDAGAWNVDRLEFRAPGLTQVRLSGRLSLAAGGVAFFGPAEIDASDPKTLVGWIEGRSENAQGELRPLNLRGDVSLASDRLAVDRLRLEYDRKPATGRLAYVFASQSQPARLDAELKAAQLDIDAALDFQRAVLSGAAWTRPPEMTLAADIGRATIAGIDARDVSARLKINRGGLQIDRLSIADYGGGRFAASGRVETSGHSPHGSLSVDVAVKQTAAISAAIETFAPRFASRVDGFLNRVGAAKLHGTLEIGGDDKAAATVAQLALAGDLAGQRLDARARVAGDWEKRAIADIRLDGTLEAKESGPLLRLMSLERIVEARKGPSRLKIQLTGRTDGDMALAIQMSSDGLSAQADGQARLSGDKAPKFVGTLHVQEADLRPLRLGTSADSLPLTLTSGVAIAGDGVVLNDIDAKLGGSNIRGRLAIDNASPRRIDGTIEADAPEAPAFIAWAIGLPFQAARSGSAWSWSGEPFGSGLFGGLAGQVALKLKRAELLPQLTASDLNATLRLGKDEIVLADAVGKLAGGGLSGQMSFHRAEDGLTAQARLSVIGADVSALLPASQPISGSVDLTAELEGMGLSPVALIGSMKGSGTLALKDGLITGLNPRVFDVVTQAADQGMPVDSGRLSDLVSKSLDSGRLSVARTDSALRIDSGQIRVDKTTVESKDAALSVACTFDLTDGLLDARLVLTGHGEAAGARPDISVGLKGPLTTPSRSVDVSALAGWLTLRAVENQAKRLQAIESAPSQPRARPASKNKQAPALPAPIDIRPAPAPRNAGRPGASVGPQN